MPTNATPALIASITWRKKQEQQAREEIERSINAHFAFAHDCDHHCSDCCTGLYLQEEYGHA